MFGKYRRTDDHVRVAPKESVTTVSPPSSPRTRLIPESIDAQRIMDETEALSGEVLMKVGKYRGRSFEYISRDKFYTRWVRQQEYPRGALGMLKTWLDKNAEWLLERNMKEALASTGPLSKRVRAWDVEEMRTRGILSAIPQVSNATFGRSRRPRAPAFSLQEAGVIPSWTPGMTKGEKWRLRCTTALVGRFLSYVFRRMLHDLRAEALTEPLIADKALVVLERNDYAYRLALKLAVPKGDPEGVVGLELLERKLQEKRDRCKTPAKRSRLPDSLRPCFTRLGCQGQGVYAPGLAETKEAKESLTTTPRRILLRFMLSIGELRDALKVYRDLENYSWDDEPMLHAAWCMARGDGAFDFDRISNDELPVPLLNVTELPIYRYMFRCAQRHFGPDVVDVNEMHYGACLGFGETGCPLEADLRVADTVYAIRGGLWISTQFDVAYLQGYAAVARANGISLDRCIIIYLQHGTILEFDLADWDHTQLLDFVQNDPEADRGVDACDLGMCEAPPDDTEEEQVKLEKQAKKAERRRVRLGGLALDQ
jgi:uncharacterized protein (DUF3820 family)